MKFTRTSARIVFDRIRPDRAVRRRIRGTEMLIPRRHVLPYMAVPGGPYAQNLVDLAAELRRDADRLVVLDIGANIGDSALLLLAEVDCRIICVEGDPQWLTYLRTNLGNDPRVAIEAVLVSPDDQRQLVTIVHADAGTSHVVQADDGSGIATVPLSDLIDRHGELADVRLVKTDTDGFDVQLAVAAARTFTSSTPVIFLEYDPVTTRRVNPGLEPSDVWGQLAEHGYADALVWTNGGHVLGHGPIGDLVEHGRGLETTSSDELGYHFWDVAVAHADDAEGRAVLARMAAEAKWPFPSRWS